MRNKFESITYKASKTFYNTTRLFPHHVRDDVFILYSFLRIADDLIDTLPPRMKEFNKYKKMTLQRLLGKKVNNDVIHEFGNLVERKHISHQLIYDFFYSLELDQKTKTYNTFQDLQKFTYGVSEVVGILMAQVMELPKKSYKTARKLGLGMQLINILRDIDEDRKLGRVYIPQDELRRFNLPSTLTFEIAKQYPKEFSSLIHFQIERIESLLKEGKKGLVAFLPKEYIHSVSCSADLYSMTARIIKKNPFIVFYRKVKPNKLQIGYVVIKNFFTTRIRHYASI